MQRAASKLLHALLLQRQRLAAGAQGATQQLAGPLDFRGASSQEQHERQQQQRRAATTSVTHPRPLGLRRLALGASLARALVGRGGSTWSAHAQQPARGFASAADGGGGDGGAGGGSAAGGGAGGGAGSPASLQASMDKLVDAAVELVEGGKLAQAVEVLQQGIDVLGAAYPGSPELGELHNQAALLLFLGGRPDEAATHAQAALELTQAAFGAAHPLTAHRLLRLATVRVGQGRGGDARPLLAVAADILSPYPEDTGYQEARFYLGLLQAAAAESPSDVAAADDSLLPPLGALVAAMGPDSMISRLALGQHSRLVGGALDGPVGFALGEALFKQHIRLQEAVAPDSPDLGLTLYQLAVTYYAHDMLGEAGAALQRGAALVRQHYPEGHELVQMFVHRLGMICAAGRDPRAAQQLLAASRAHYAAAAAAAAQGGPGGGSAAGGDHPLVAEADAGLAMAAFKALHPKLPPPERRVRQAELLADIGAAAARMAAALGPGHLLVAGVQRYAAQLAAIAGP
ncbi:MAG: hypothetical protein J3K34DRAFT_115370 [Monoraphidium minutum]|nr:MAG: hypothetical protein J3K34DRAFT_115370 [Monoraphidium minutum]